MCTPEGNAAHPRIKKGTMIIATRDSAIAAKVDLLLSDSYMARHVTQKPDYWTRLLEMVYGAGRHRKYTGAVEDIVDKFSFLLLARDQVFGLENTANPDKRFYVKYYAYTFVFMMKSLLDSLAVFVNSIYTLGFHGGGIDFKRKKFIDAVKAVDPFLGSAIAAKEQWICYVAKYRDNLIHRHGLYVGALPTVPEEMTDPVEIDNFIMREHHYMPTDPNLTAEDIIDGKEVEFIKVSALIGEWVAEALVLVDAVLKTFSTRFEYVEPDNHDVSASAPNQGLPDG
jgi:hypothetical protein